MRWLKKGADGPENNTEPGQLDIHPNMLVEVLSAKNTLVFVGRVLSFDGKNLTVKDAKDGDLPPVVYNSEIKLRFFQGGQTLVLQGMVCGSTKLIWKVDRLRRPFGAERRNGFRQTVDLGAVMTLLASSQPTDQIGVPVRIRVLDVSLGGLMLSCPGGLRTGDRLSVSELRLSGQASPFTLRCQVRRIQVTEGKYYYGCRIDRLPPKEEDRLLQAIFSIQRENLSRQRGGGL